MKVKESYFSISSTLFHVHSFIDEDHFDLIVTVEANEFLKLRVHLLLISP
jgi:hypothetical protein